MEPILLKTTEEAKGKRLDAFLADSTEELTRSAAAQLIETGGVLVNRPSTVVLAMHDAKQVAEGIAQYVDAIKLLEAINMDDELKKTGDNK